VIQPLDEETPVFARLGELSYDPDEDRVQCHLCGGWFRLVGGTHLTRTHGWTLAEYREAFHLAATMPTCSRGLSEEHRAHTKRRIAAGELPAAGPLLDRAARVQARARGLARWRSLAVKHPELLAELHPCNGNLDGHSIAAGSNRKLWWRCGHGHEWLARVADRTAGGACPVCTNQNRGRALGARNQRVSADRSLAVKRPDLFEQLHPTRNGAADLATLGAGSGRKMWWSCREGHEWQATVANRSGGTGCPACSAEQRGRALRARVAVVPSPRSLAVKHPELLAELHPTRNGDLDACSIGAGSARKVWWQCRSGHEWHARVNDRSRGSGCPVCTKQRPVSPERSIAVKHPELVAELHPSRNGDLDPRGLAAGSNVKLWWRCALGHEWAASVAARSRGTACPVCSRTRVTAERSLAVRHPELLAELHPTRNDRLDPWSLAASSNAKVWWRCRDGHEWAAVVSSRSGGSGCPVCYQQRRARKAASRRA
jgi:hypothetical protein